MTATTTTQSNNECQHTASSANTSQTAWCKWGCNVGFTNSDELQRHQETCLCRLPGCDNADVDRTRAEFESQRLASKEALQEEQRRKEREEQHAPILSRRTPQQRQEDETNQESVPSRTVLDMR